MVLVVALHSTALKMEKPTSEMTLSNWSVKRVKIGLKMSKGEKKILSVLRENNGVSSQNK